MHQRRQPYRQGGNRGRHPPSEHVGCQIGLKLLGHGGELRALGDGIVCPLSASRKLRAQACQLARTTSSSEWADSRTHLATMSLRFRSSASTFSPPACVPVWAISSTSPRVASWMLATFTGSSYQLELEGARTLPPAELTALTNPAPSLAIHLFLNARD